LLLDVASARDVPFVVQYVLHGLGWMPLEFKYTEGEFSKKKVNFLKSNKMYG